MCETGPCRQGGNGTEQRSHAIKQHKGHGARVNRVIPIKASAPYVCIRTVFLSFSDHSEQARHRFALDGFGSTNLEGVKSPSSRQFAFERNNVMACTSGSVQTTADKTVAAKLQIDKLQAMIKEQEGVNKAAFFDSIASHLSDANVNDGREISYASDIKTEYTSEFSLDKIASVVTSALKAVVASQDPTAKVPAMSPAAVAAYVDVVNAVAEAAKSSSTSSASLSFSMTRLSPGMFAFLSATSISIKDADTFGTEAVTTTAIYYRFMQSLDDVKNEAKFGEAVIDAKNLMNMKTLQAALTDDLACGKINIDEWNKKDDAYSLAVSKIESRLNAAKFDNAKPLILKRKAGFGAAVHHSFNVGSETNQAVVLASIKKLSKMGSGYKGVVEKSNARLAKVYF